MNQSAINLSTQPQPQAQNTVLYELCIYNERRQLIFYFDIANQKIYNKEETENIRKEARIQNMNGISDALKTFTNKFSKTPAVNIKYFITNKYKYSIYETYSGVKIILLSSPEEQDFEQFLRDIFTNIYLQYVVRNPMYQIGDVIECPLFIKLLEQEILNFHTFVVNNSQASNPSFATQSSVK